MLGLTYTDSYASSLNLNVMSSTAGRHASAYGIHDVMRRCHATEVGGCNDAVYVLEMPTITMNKAMRRNQRSIVS